jgi:acetylornithine deacetylase/succinyl-diaminopimelate desuccinylase-like protein
MIDDVLTRIDDNLPAILDRLFALLSIDRISTDPAYAASVAKADDWLVSDLAGMGFTASSRPTPGHPVVVGHHAGNGPHALFYAHYDVQPVDPIELWDSPPFSPRLVTMPDGRKVIAARGAADDKGQMMTFIEALRAWKAVTGSLPARVSVMLEGEEESGSASLKPFMEANAAELTPDVAFICDTGMWNSERPAITTSLRGLVGEEITITAADQDLHSGMFGGPARNPIHVLAGIIAALRDDDGRVTIPDFYDGVGEIPEEISRQWQGLGFDPKEFLGGVGLSEPAGERNRSVLEQIWSRPTCEVNGIWGGYTQPGFKTVIPSKASAKISFRLVGDQDPGKITENFRAFVRRHVPADCTLSFTSFGSSPGLRLPVDGPYLTRARQALKDEWGQDPALVGGGGSIPVAGYFRDVLDVSPLMIGFGLKDDRIHSPNEKYDLSSFHGGIRSWARILAALAT